MELAIPANWGEIIEAGQYLDTVKILNTEYASEAAMKMELVKLFSGLNGFDLGKEMKAGNEAQRKKKAEQLDLLIALQLMEDVFPELDFLKEEKFTENPLPTFELNGIIYAGPDARLLNQTGEEWTISHHANTVYYKTKDEKHLLALIAANYHRVKNEKRSALNADEMKEDAEAFKALSAEMKLGIYLWYYNCEHWWSKKYTELYGEGDEKNGKPDKGKEIWELMFTLSGSELGTNYDRVQQRNRQEIFMALEKLEKDAQKREMDEMSNLAR